MQREGRALLAVATSTQAVAVGATVGTFTLFVEPLERAFSASRAEVSLGNSLIVLALALAGPFVGSAFDRGSARSVMLLGGALLASALLLAASATRFATLALAALLAGCAVPMIGPLASLAVVSRAFAGERGRAMGVVGVGAPLGSGLFAALVGGTLPVWGWRGSYRLLAALALVVVLPLVWRFVPRRLEAAGEGGAAGPAALATGALARMPAFWTTALVYALGAGIAAGWTGQLGPFLGEAGLGERGRAGVVALQFWAGIPGTLLFGALAGRFGASRLFAGILLYQALAFAAYALGVPGGFAACLAVGSGFAGGGLVPLFSLLLGQRVGARAVGRAMGIANLLFLPCTVGAISLASSVHDRGGDYRPAQAAFACGMLLAIASLWLSEREALRRARAAA